MWMCRGGAAARSQVRPPTWCPLCRRQFSSPGMPYAWYSLYIHILYTIYYNTHYITLHIHIYISSNAISRVRQSWSWPSAAGATIVPRPRLPLLRVSLATSPHNSTWSFHVRLSSFILLLFLALSLSSLHCPVCRPIRTLQLYIPPAIEIFSFDPGLMLLCARLALALHRNV